MHNGIFVVNARSQTLNFKFIRRTNSHSAFLYFASCCLLIKNIQTIQYIFLLN